MTSLTWRECCTTGQQAPMQSSTAWPHNQQGKWTRISNRFNNGGWSHRYGFEQGSTHRLHTQTEDVSAFQNQHTGYPRNQHRLFFPVSELHPIFLQRSDGMYGSEDRVEWKRTPSRSSSWPFYSHALGLTLVTLGTACVHQHASALHVFPLPGT
jgi:hypothetical protein